jgi:hypothetical protein
MLIKSGKRQDVAEMHLYDGQDRLIGHAVGTFVVLPDVSVTKKLRLGSQKTESPL